MNLEPPRRPCKHIPAVFAPVQYHGIREGGMALENRVSGPQGEGKGLMYLSASSELADIIR